MGYQNFLMVQANNSLTFPHIYEVMCAKLLVFYYSNFSYARKTVQSYMPTM